jgi:hypothetical protein
MAVWIDSFAFPYEVMDRFLRLSFFFAFLMRLWIDSFAANAAKTDEQNPHG